MSESKDSKESSVKAPTHLSHSALSSMHSCLHKYKVEYLDGNWSSPNLALTFGKAIDEALSEAYLEKRDRGALPGVKTVAGRFKRLYYEKLLEKLEYKGLPEDLVAQVEVDNRSALARILKEFKKHLWVRLEEDESPADLEDRGNLLLNEYLRDIAPTINPKLVQDSSVVTFPGLTTGFKGVIDLFTEEGILIDIKTSANAYSERDIVTSEQLTGYQAILEERGIEVKGLSYHVLIKKTKGKFIQILSAPSRTKAQIQAWKRAFTAQVNAAKSRKYYPPCAADSWLCSPKFCTLYPTGDPGQKNVCPYRAYAAPVTEATVED